MVVEKCYKASLGGSKDRTLCHKNVHEWRIAQMDSKNSWHPQATINGTLQGFRNEVRIRDIAHHLNRKTADEERPATVSVASLAQFMAAGHIRDIFALNMSGELIEQRLPEANLKHTRSLKGALAF